jgi:hypothetical protein
MVALGRPAEAVVLAGAAARLREALGGGFTVQHYRADADEPQAAARQHLSEREYAVAWARGRAMGLDDAVRYAGGELTP